jgi:hypothetical protein
MRHVEALCGNSATGRMEAAVSMKTPRARNASTHRILLGVPQVILQERMAVAVTKGQTSVTPSARSSRKDGGRCGVGQAPSGASLRDGGCTLHAAALHGLSREHHLHDALKLDLDELGKHFLA